MTECSPKAVVSVGGQSLLEWQLDQLEACGVERVRIVTGFAAQRIDTVLADRQDNGDVQTRFNPFFAVADNLISCWVAQQDMREDFVLINGDTLFEAAVLRRLLDSAPSPVTLAMDRKAHYDDDDMKVQLDQSRLVRIGKDLPQEQSDGESIGMIVFRGEGPRLFRKALERSVRRPEALRQWYLSVIGQMATSGHVRVQSVVGLDWAEVDYPLDLMRATKMVGRWASAREEAINAESANPGQ